LADGRPKSSREVMEATGLKEGQVYNCLFRCWKGGLVLRTERPIYRRERVFKGRGGVSTHTRPYHLYILRPEGLDEVVVEGHRFVGFSEERLDPRGGGALSKARRILEFLKEHGDEAFFSKDIAEALKEFGVKPRDVMSNVRRFERQGLVYVRGYKTDERQTPFKRGYLITWLDQDKPREEAIEEAVQRTERALEAEPQPSAEERPHADESSCGG